MYGFIRCTILASIHQVSYSFIGFADLPTCRFPNTAPGIERTVSKTIAHPENREVTSYLNLPYIIHDAKPSHAFTMTRLATSNVQIPAAEIYTAHLQG